MLISIVIPSKDRINLLIKAINSISDKNNKEIQFEILIIDNASKIPIERNLFASQYCFKIIRNDTMLSAAKNRNIGAKHASGEWICFLDDDDIYTSKKFIDLKDYLKDNAIDFIFGNTKQIDGNGNQITISRGICDLEKFLRWRFIHCNALAVRKKVFKRLKFNENMETYEDVEFIGKLMRNFNGIHIDNIHAIWYREKRSDQLTNRNISRSKRNWKILCEEFSHEINNSLELKKFYLHKMITLSIMRIDIISLYKNLKIRFL